MSKICGINNLYNILSLGGNGNQYSYCFLLGVMLYFVYDYRTDY